MASGSRITEKQSVTFATSDTNNIHLNLCHFCSMQTPMSRKLQKVNDTSVSDLTTEVTALMENLTGSVKLT
jgi:hypothetical protein